MDPRRVIRTALRICAEEKRVLSSGDEWSSRVYGLYEKEISGLNELAQKAKDDPEFAKELLRILVDELMDYPVWCSLIVDSGLWEAIMDADEKLKKLALFLMRREFSEEAVEELMKTHKGRALLAGRIEERIRNAILRRLEGSTYVPEEVEELRRLLRIAEKLDAYIDKRILERRKRIVECISR